jgi:hypothetical protein
MDFTSGRSMAESHGKSWPASPPSSHDIERNSPS